MCAMSLHDSLRELVAVRGAGVVDEAEEFRGALDDFLAEDEATIGEINLLVDAVRLGAVRRVLDVLDHGAAPDAAVRDAGAGLARDRGTDDPARSCWALAALCFALGKVDDELVRMFRADAGTVSAPQPPTAPHGRAPDPVEPVPDTSGRPHTPVLEEGAVSSRPTPPTPPDLGPHSTAPKPTPPETAAVHQPEPPHPPVVPEPRRSSRAGVLLLVVLVALILGGLVAAGFILLRSGDDPTASDDPSDSDTASSSEGPRKPPPLVSDDEMLVPYVDGDVSVIYAVNAIEGGYRQPELTAGPDDGLPTLSPDRRTMTYLGSDAAGRVLFRFDLKSSGYQEFFPEDGPCDHSGRPGWSLDGAQVAIVCAGPDDNPDGIWLADADGTLQPDPVIEDALVRGSPTWISETEFVYGRQEDDSKTAPFSFWKFDVESRDQVQLQTELEPLQVTHIDWSPEAQKLLFLTSPPGAKEIGNIWTMDADGGNLELLKEGSFAHPVWSPNGDAIGVTIFTTLPSEDSPGVEVLGYIPIGDSGEADEPVVVADPPPGEVGIPVWGTR